MSASETFTNPLESGRINSTIGQRGKGVDATISSATCINAATFQELLTRLTLVESNEERLTIVEQEKTKFLFTSAQLIALIEITPSVKTRLSIITMIGPRLTDPRAKVTELMGMFRYSEEKERVQEVLKGRTQVLASSLFKPSGLSAAIVGTTTTSTTSTDGSPPTSAVKSAAPAFEFKGLAAARPRTTTQTITTKPRSPSNATPVGVEGLTMMNSSETMTSTTTTTTATATSSMAKNSRNNQHLSNAAPSSSQKVPVDHDRSLSSAEVQQLSHSIRSKGKVKAMIQAFSKGAGSGGTSSQDDDNSPSMSTETHSQTNSQSNSFSGTPEDSPRNDVDSPGVFISPHRPLEGKIGSPGYAPPPPSTLSPSRGLTGTANKTTTTTTTTPTTSSKKTIIPDVPWTPPTNSSSSTTTTTTATAAAISITKPREGFNHSYLSTHKPPQLNSEDENNNNGTSSQSTNRNGPKNKIGRSPSDDSGFGENLPSHTRTPLTTQNKAWSFFGMDFSCMSFTFMGDNDNNKKGEDDSDSQQSSDDALPVAPESRCS